MSTTINCDMCGDELVNSEISKNKIKRIRELNKN